MTKVSIRFKGKVWIYEGKAAWHFVTLPKRLSAKIKKDFGFMKRGWGSLPVTISVGQTQWKSSIFPDGKRDAYLLPIKAEVRIKQKIKAGETRAFVIEIEV